MPRRIDIELTSHAGGRWTWRAAGAKQPKGSLDEDVVPAGASVGDLLRAEVEAGMEGLEITALVGKAERSGEHPTDRIEVLGVPGREAGISVTYAPGARRRRDDGERPGRRPGRGEEGRQTGGRHAEDRGPGRGPGRGVAGGHPGGPGRPRPAPADRAEGEARRPERPRDRRPGVSTVHRNALLATLGPEQLPVAEHLLRGGMPAVRKAIDELQGAQQIAAGNADPLLSIAEELLPAVNLASWKDRAAAAQAEGAQLHLRDLRAVVAASRAVTLDEEGRTMARAVKEVQDRRVAALRTEWADRIEGALDTHRVLDALTAAQRVPEPATRLPAELAVKLADEVGATMTAALPAPEWTALLDAVLDSPVRRTVKPSGIPATPVAREAARHAAGMVPALAKLLGLRIPPPPPRRVVVRRQPLSRSSGGGPAAAL